MGRTTRYYCDRPGCVNFADHPLHVTSVFVREPPVGDLGTQVWDLCASCYNELEHARIQTELNFGDRLRAKPSGKILRG